MKRFLLGFGSALVLVAIAGFVVIAHLDVSATAKPGLMDRCLGSISLSAIRRAAPAAKNPFAGDAKAAAEGRDHYKENCLDCHGAPGVEPAELAKGLHPPAPDLASKPMQDLTDGQLYWVISNGIQMTGMPAFSPTHTDEEIWHIVTFVRTLPALTDEDRAALGAGREGEEEHHHTDGK